MSNHDFTDLNLDFKVNMPLVHCGPLFLEMKIQSTNFFHNDIKLNA